MIGTGYYFQVVMQFSESFVLKGLLLLDIDDQSLFEWTSSDMFSSKILHVFAFQVFVSFNLSLQIDELHKLIWILLYISIMHVSEEYASHFHSTLQSVCSKMVRRCCIF